MDVNRVGERFLSNTNDPWWLLIALTLNIIVLYALIVRWDESVPQRSTV